MGERNSTFVKPYRIMNEKRPAHVGDCWSDDLEISHVQCLCGWTDFQTDAQAVIDAWRAHCREAS